MAGRRQSLAGSKENHASLLYQATFPASVEPLLFFGSKFPVGDSAYFFSEANFRSPTALTFFRKRISGLRQHLLFFGSEFPASDSTYFFSEANFQPPTALTFFRKQISSLGRDLTFFWKQIPSLGRGLTFFRKQAGQVRVGDSPGRQAGNLHPISCRSRDSASKR